MAAQSQLDDLAILEDTLREQWEAQVQEQTKPAPRKYFCSKLFAYTYYLFVTIHQAGLRTRERKLFRLYLFWRTHWPISAKRC
jgi:hypothetical protein